MPIVFPFLMPITKLELMSFGPAATRIKHGFDLPSSRTRAPGVRGHDPAAHLYRGLGEPTTRLISRKRHWKSSLPDEQGRVLIRNDQIGGQT